MDTLASVGQRPIRLLSLDGGGIRGLSSIIILKEIMRQVNRGVPAAQHLQPWQVFDLIGGTSTGGIIAVMLGRLRMSLKECEEAYLKLGKEIFEPKRGKWDGRRLIDFVQANEKFDSSILESSIRTIIGEKTGDENTPLKPLDTPADGDCKVFLCSVLEANSEPVFLRTYESGSLADPLSDDFALWQALRATSAASTFFDAYQHGVKKFVDGGFAYNNPVQRVMIEAADLWGTDRPSLLISIGTGESMGQSLGGNLKGLAECMARLVTQTERTADDFYSSHTNMIDNDMYFRFNVTGLANIGMQEYKEVPAIDSHTIAYLTKGTTGRGLSAVVRMIKNKQLTDGPNSARVNVEDLSKEDKECIQALYLRAGDYKSHIEQLDQPVNGTCAWIFEHPKFLKFRDSKDASFLWVTGNAGCGKSILARFLTDHLGAEEKAAPAPIVCSFFFKVGQDKRTESQSAVSALLHQLFVARPILSFCGRAEYAAKSSDFTQSPEAVWKIMCEACTRIPQREVICIVDALDECSEFSRKRFIDMMLSTFMVPSAKKTAGFLKVLVTSRPWLEIEELFGPDSSIRLRGEDETYALNNDIGMVVEHRINDFQRRGILSTETGEVVKRILNEKADGTFLWISLVLESIKSLKSYTPSAIENRLTGIPKDLDALYARALPESDDNTDAKKSRKLLGILLAATRPLELGEIGICLSLDSTTTKLCHMDEEPNIDRAVKGFGGFFIRIAKKQVSLVHQTAREYLLQNDGATPGKFWKHSISNFESNLTLAWSCLQFLLLQDWVEYLEFLEKADPENYGAHLSNALPASQGSFYHYAAVNWFRHVEAGSVNHESPPELRNIISKLCDQSKIPFATWWSFSKSRQGYSGKSFLHWAAEEGNLVFLKESFRANPLPITAEKSRILEAAAKGNQCRVLDWMSLEFGTDELDVKPALIQAIRNGEVSVVERIIKISLLDMNGEYSGENPLQVAVSKGDMAIIQLLVKGGVDPCNEEAFRTAIWKSRQDIMRFLLESVGGDNPGKRAILLLRGLETIVTKNMITRNMVTEMFKSMMDQGLALPRPYKEPFKLADAAHRHDASSVLQLIGDDTPDERGIALILGSHEPEVLSPLLAVGNYETKQIWEAFRYLDFGTAGLYRKLLAPRLRGSDHNFDFATTRSPLLATNISPKKRDGCLQLFLRKLTGLNRHFSNNAITRFLTDDGDMQQSIPIPTLIGTLDKTVPETAASFFTLASVCGADHVILQTSSCLKVNLKDRHGMTPLLAAVLARSDGLSSYLLEHGANPGIISWYTAGVDEPTVEDSMVSKESSEFPVIDQEGENGGLSLSMLGDMLISTDQTWESIWDILGRDTFVESPFSLGYKDGVTPFATEKDGVESFARDDDAKLFGWYDGKTPAPFQIVLETQPTEVAQYSLGFLQYKRLCEGPDVNMRTSRSHLKEPRWAFFNDVPTNLILPTPYAPDLSLSGRTALHLAAKYGLDSLILELLQHEQSASAVDQDGMTPLHLYIGDDIAIIETMLCSGASLAAVDHMGRTPLHTAAIANTTGAVAFIRCHSPIETKTKEGRTPLHEAVIYQRWQSSGVKHLVECLIEAGASPLARDAIGLTPLHYSIEMAKTIQSTEIIEVLVKGMIRTGGLLTTRYDGGLTVLEFAEKIRHQAFGSDKDMKAMDDVVAVLNKVGTWGYSGLDQDEICGFYESMKAGDPSRVDPFQLDWYSEDDIDEAEMD